MNTTPTNAARRGKMCDGAWLLRGISAIPGELRLSNGRISFTASGPGSAWDWQLRKLDRHARTADFTKRLNQGASTLLFSERVEDVRIDWPWYYFGGGLVIRTAHETYRLSFGRPARTSGGGGLWQAADELRTVSRMRQVGKRWLGALAGRFRPGARQE